MVARCLTPPSGSGLSVWSLRVCVTLRVLRLPPADQSYAVNVIRLIGDSKLRICVYGCLSLCVSTASDWWPVEGVPCLSPYCGWGRFQPPATLIKISRRDFFPLKFCRVTVIWKLKKVLSLVKHSLRTRGTNFRINSLKDDIWWPPL